MSAVVDPLDAAPKSPAWVHEVLVALREEGGTWLFVLRTLLSFFITAWLAMRLELEQPSTAMLTTIIVANRQSGMVLAKSFYRGIGTLCGALAAIAIVALFPQQPGLFLLAMALWVGVCTGGATLYRNFKSYAFVLAGYTAGIVALPVVDDATGIFDSVTARISEVLLGLLVSGVISDTVFPSRMRNMLWRTAREQFAHFVGFVRSVGDSVAGEVMERAHMRCVRDAVALEDLRSAVVFEDADARARSGHLQLFNQRFMAASTSFQSVHHLINRLRRDGRSVPADALAAFYAPIAQALDLPVHAGPPAQRLESHLIACREQMEVLAPQLRQGLHRTSDLRDFDTGATLLERFAEELRDYVASAETLEAPQMSGGRPEKVRFERGNDFAGAALAMLRSTLALLLLGSFWMRSAWPQGASALINAIIFAGLFASAPAAKRLSMHVLLGYATGMSSAFICVFYVLTRMDGYLLMVAGILPFLLPGVVGLASARFGSYSLGYAMGLTTILAIKNPMVFDPAHFMNDMIAQLVGVGVAAVAFMVIPPAVGTAWLRRRQLDRFRAQVALAAEAPLNGLLHRFESINHDLLSQAVAQNQPSGTASRALLAWMLAIHETGRALIALRQELRVARSTYPFGLGPDIDAMITALARFYEHPDRTGYMHARRALAVAIASAERHGPRRALLDHLYLIRLSLLDRQSVIGDYMPSTHAPSTHGAAMHMPAATSAGETPRAS
jgi:uncharacterized membrane protein YccC